jgi:hypothetical protein
MTRIEAPIYPESLYLASACYQKMGEVLANQKAGLSRAESEKIMDDTIDYAEVSEAVRQELSLLFAKNYWAKKSRPMLTNSWPQPWLLSRQEEGRAARSRPVA